LKNKKIFGKHIFTTEGYNKTIKEYLNPWNLTEYTEDEVNIYVFLLIVNGFYIN